MILRRIFKSKLPVSYVKSVRLQIFPLRNCGITALYDLRQSEYQRNEKAPAFGTSYRQTEVKFRKAG